MNVKYSDNLGDGVLVWCLERALAGYGFEVSSFDLSGRKSIGDGLKSRGLILAMLQKLPKPLRRVTTWLALNYLAESKIRPRLREVLRVCDAVVLGGGNLISDIDLNFPIKISAALAEAKRAGKPVAVFGVGVGDDWSWFGARLFHKAFRDAKLGLVLVRDERSREIWDWRMERVAPAAAVCPDPGVLASLYWPSHREGCSTKKVVGLSLMSPVALSYHGASLTGRHNGLQDWTLDLIRLLVREGYAVRLFSNGGAEDDDFLRQVAARVSADKHTTESVEVTERPLTAEEFVRNVAACDALVAHRLHANIVAYSYGIPSVGLSWDAKLNSFMKSVGRGQYVLHTDTCTPCDVLASISQVLREGVDLKRRQQTLESASGAIGRLAQHLETAIADSFDEPAQ